VQLLAELRDARSRHEPLGWKHATLSRDATPRLFAGQPADRYSVKTEDGRSASFLVEAALPHRVFHWENSLGEHADFVSSSRVTSLAALAVK